MANKGFCFWFTGLPSAGKTTIARTLRPKLQAREWNIELLDGNDARQGEIREMTGIDAPDEVPERPDIRVDTVIRIPEEAARYDLSELDRLGGPVRP